MTLFAWVLAGAGVLYGLHRLSSWMEDRGWIYYRKKRGSSGSMLEPGKRYVLEEKRKEDVDDEESGDPPAGAGRHRS